MSNYECRARPPAPDEADQLVEDVEQILDDRKGMGWGYLDKEILDELRLEMVDMVRQRLREIREG